MEKEIYESPLMDITKFDSEDVITTSEPYVDGNTTDFG